jgi:carbon-monoxide dehydrogenase medium subunit
MDIAVVSAAASVTLDEEGRCTACRIALGAVSPVPLRVTRAEELLVGERPTDALLEEVGRLARAAARPISDIRGGAEYRSTLAGVLAKRMVAAAYARALGNGQTPSHQDVP